MMIPTEMKEEFLRALLLSASLEPLANKPGCTTRAVDSTPGTKLEYFIISAVNSLWPFSDMIDAISDIGGQPDCLYQYAYQAQMKSTRNRYGGKVNYGIILLLLPIVAAQAILTVEGGSSKNPNAVFSRAHRLLKATTVRDVEFLQKTVDLSRQLSQKHHQRLGTTRLQLYPQFLGEYENILDSTHAEGFSHTTIAMEMRDGYPRCAKIVRTLSGPENLGLIERSEVAYRNLLPEFDRPDVLADCLVVGLYLRIFGNQSEVLFP